MENVRAGSYLEHCPVCGGGRFTMQDILWADLIKAWELSSDEIAYINLQQGFCCVACENNLRSMTLASAVMNAFSFDGTFRDFCRTSEPVRRLTVLEVNSAKHLTPFLQELPRHQLRSFPHIDLQQMDYEDASIDLIIHSDTLEHVSDSAAALTESFRVLRPGGYLFYTIPIVVGRLTRTRRGLPPSYHGKEETASDDYLVRTEYGADFWCEILEAGFSKIALTTLMFPASVAISAAKK